MAAKGAIKGDHIPVNKYLFLIAGLPPITVTKISGIEEEIERTELPDRTRATGGHKKPVEFEIEVPMHHTIEQLAIELAYREGQDPVSPTYKKIGTLSGISGTGKISRSFSLLGVWFTKRGLPEFDMKNEGEMASVKWGVSADDIVPLPGV